MSRDKERILSRRLQVWTHSDSWKVPAWYLSIITLLRFSGYLCFINGSKAEEKLCWWIAFQELSEAHGTWSLLVRLFALYNYCYTVFTVCKIQRRHGTNFIWPDWTARSLLLCMWLLHSSSSHKVRRKTWCCCLCYSRFCCFKLLHNLQGNLVGFQSEKEKSGFAVSFLIEIYQEHVPF